MSEAAENRKQSSGERMRVRPRARACAGGASPPAARHRGRPAERLHAVERRAHGRREQPALLESRAEPRWRANSSARPGGRRRSGPLLDGHDEWLRKQVYTGMGGGHPAYCAMSNQAACIDPAHPDQGGRRAASGSSTASVSSRVSGIEIDQVSASPQAYGLVFVDQQGTIATLDPERHRRPATGEGTVLDLDAGRPCLEPGLRQSVRAAAQLRARPTTPALTRPVAAMRAVARA